MGFIKNNLFTKVDSIGLSVFRMFYSVVLFCEISQLFKFRHIIYDKVPFVSIGEIDVAFIFYFWFIVAVFIFFGLFTRVSAIINYIFSVIIFSSATNFEYHVFYAYVGINFLLIFIPISKVFSLDSLIQKLKYTQIGKPYTLNSKVLEVNYLMPVFVAVALVYFDSIFYKLSSKMWMDGLGVWLPSSLPMVIWNDTSLLLNQEVLVKFLGYLVMVFETGFIFLFWFRKWRVPLLLLGVFFHLGILIAYPIPWFALVAVAAYILLIPQGFWNAISKKLKFKKAIYLFYYDAECPLCNKIIVVIKHFDIFNAVQCLSMQGNYRIDDALKKYDEETLLVNIHGVTSSGKVVSGYQAYVQLFKSLIYTFPLGLLGSLPGVSFIGRRIYAFIAENRITQRCTSENCYLPVYNEPIPENQDILLKGWNQLALTRKFWIFLLLFFSGAQCLMIWYSPFVQQNIPAREKLNKVVSIPYNQSEWFLVKYLGITHHPVFMFNNHFAGYKIIFKIESVDERGQISLVPLLNEKGMVVNSYAQGAFWVNSTFRVNSPKFNLKQYEEGVIPYLKFYQQENAKTENYIFYVKEINPKEKWENDFLKKQIEKPWIKVGSCKIEKDSVNFIWNGTMQKILKNESVKK